MSLDDRIQAAAAEPDSQFLPDTRIQYAWDSVSLTSIMACPRRYEYAVIKGYVPTGTNYAIALSFGILFHKGQEVYQKLRAVSGQDHEQALHETVAYICAQPETAALPIDTEVEELEATAKETEEQLDGITARNSKVRTRYHLLRALVWYLEQFADDPAQTLIMPSGTPAVELSFRIPLELPDISHPILLCGHIDRAVQMDGYLYVSDYKTTKAIDSYFLKSFDLSHQMTGYIIAGQVLFEQPVKGCIIDGVALQVGGVKLGRGVTTRTPGQIGEYMQLLREVNLNAERYALQGYYPMNTSACFFCDYKEVCRQPPEYRNRYLRTYFEQKRGWNPLENR